jgi:hypothetical protein
VQANSFQADVRDKLETAINAAQHSLAELKAQMHTRRHEDERAWKGIREGFNKAAKDLEAAFDKARYERAS